MYLAIAASYTTTWLAEQSCCLLPVVVDERGFAPDTTGVTREAWAEPA